MRRCGHLCIVSAVVLGPIHTERLRLFSLTLPSLNVNVSVQKTSLVVVLRAVGSAFIISAVSGTVVVGNVQSWGLY